MQDVIASSNGAEALNGGNGNDLLFGNDGIDNINGQGGNDLLVGGGGDDILVGGGGDDFMFGGAGNDGMDGGGTNDDITFVYGSVLNATDVLSNGSDTITSFDATGGVGNQDFINLDALFDSLGVATADRAVRYQVSGGSQLQIDLDNNGSFEYTIATVTTTAGVFDILAVNHGSSL